MAKPINKKRIEEIDIIKALGIICVAAGHGGTPFEHFIYLFHMAVFFIASGFFYKPGSSSSLGNLWKSFIKKMKEIWVPFVIWNTVYVLLHNFFIKINVYTDNPAIADYVEGPYVGTQNYKTLSQMIPTIRNGLFLREGPQLAGAFWFLASLFWVQLLYFCIDFILQKIVKKQVDLFQGIVSVLLLSYGYYCSIQRLYIYGFAKVASFYCLYYLGHLLSRKKDLLMQMKWYFWLPAGIISFAALYIMGMFGSISFAQVKYVNPVYMLTASVCGWFMLYSIAFFLKSIPGVKKPLMEIGRRTLSVVIFHFLAFKLVAAIVVRYYGVPAFCIAAFPNLYGNRGWWLGYTIVGVSVPVLADYLYHRAKNWCGNMIRHSDKQK